MAGWVTVLVVASGFIAAGTAQHDPDSAICVVNAHGVTGVASARLAAPAPSLYSSLHQLCDEQRVRRWFHAQIMVGDAVHHLNLHAEPDCSLSTETATLVVNHVCGEPWLRAHDLAACGRAVLELARRAARSSCERFPLISSHTHSHTTVLPARPFRPFCALVGGARLSTERLLSPAPALRSSLPDAPASGSDRPFRVVLAWFCYQSSDPVRVGMAVAAVHRVMLQAAGNRMSPPKGFTSWDLTLHLHFAVPNATARTNWTQLRGNRLCNDRVLQRLADVEGDNDGAEVSSDAFQRAADAAESCPGGEEGEALLPTTTRDALASLRRTLMETNGPARLRVWAHSGVLGRLFAWSARERSRREALAEHTTQASASGQGPLHAFSFFEEDHDVSLLQVRAHWVLRQQPWFPATWLPMMLQVEQRNAAASHGSDAVASHLISPGMLNSRSFLLYQGAVNGTASHTDGQRAGPVLLSMENVHQGGFLLVGSDVALLADTCLSTRAVPHWFYPVIEAADSQALFACGRPAVVPLPLEVDATSSRPRAPRPGDVSWPFWAALGGSARWSEAWFVRHVAGNYLATAGTATLHGHPLTATHLLHWASRCFIA